MLAVSDIVLDPNTTTSFRYRLIASAAIVMNTTSMKYCSMIETMAHSGDTLLLWTANMNVMYSPNKLAQRLSNS